MNTKMRWAGGVLGVLLGLILILPWALGLDPDALSETQFDGPSWRHWLGTDANGRDLLARVCVGARVSLLVGLAGAGVSLVIGVGWGLVSGYLGGRWDRWMMRGVDLLYALPSVLIVIVLAAVLQDSVRAVLEAWVGRAGGEWASILFLVLGLGGVSWLTMARIVRGQVQSLKQRPFVEAARALGAGPLRILGRHLLPNLTGIVLVYLTLTIPSIVLGESFLSFLGLGVQPPHASLGSLMADGAGQINPMRMRWTSLLGPGGVLVGMLMALGYLGDGVKAWLAPKDA